MKPAVSIITPTYNRLHTLPRLWASLKSQTLANFEWIVIDDGSADGTGDWIKGLGDKRIVYHWQKNKGMGLARNQGMKYIAGDYVIYIDSDDAFYRKTSLADMVGEIESAPKDIGVVAFPYVDKDGVRRFDSMHQKRVVMDYTQRACNIFTMGDFICILRRAVNDPIPFLAHNTDYVRHLAVARHTKTLYVNKPMGVYYYYAGDWKADNLKGLKALFRDLDVNTKGIEDIIANHKNTWIAHCPIIYGRHCLSLALNYALQAKRFSAIAQLVHAFRYGTWQLRVKALILFALLFLPNGLFRKSYTLYTKLLQGGNE